MVAFISRVAGSTTTTPVAVATLFTGGTSSLPMSVAVKTLLGTALLTEFTWFTLALAAVGLMGLLSLPQPVSTISDSKVIHPQANRCKENAFMSRPLLRNTPWRLLALR